MQTGLVGQRERRSSEAKQASERPSAVLCNGSQKEISYLVLQRCCCVCCLVNQGQLICHTECLCVCYREKGATPPNESLALIGCSDT